MIKITIDPNRRFHTWEALTNIAYLLAGAIIWLITPDFTAIVPTIALIYLAIGSYLCHLNIKENYCQFDWSGMVAVFTAIITYGAGISPLFSAIYTVLAAIIPIAYRIDHLPKFISYSIIGLLWIISTALLFNLTAVTLFAIAFAIRQMGDLKYDINSEEELFHAGWHVLSAMGFVLMFF